jgi:hypothetical protein
MLLANEVCVETTMKEVGKYLEQQAKRGAPINYVDVVKNFPAIPSLGPHWKSHPLCTIFGDLDIEDERHKRPFRTALVFAKETGRPGDGFHEMIDKLRGVSVSKSQKDKIWTDELKALLAYYK